MQMRISVLLAVVLFCLAAGSAQAQDAGKFFQDCPKCPEMAVIPAGEFIMGDKAGRPTEKPTVRVKLARPFALSRTEITWNHWQACVAAKGCDAIASDHGWGRGKRPVINMTFAQAEAYIAWLSRITGKIYRMPSEAEWEYAARGGTRTHYWWGDEVGQGLANCRECGAGEFSGHKSAPTRTFKPNPFGLYEMHGNIWEWTADCWHPNHEGADPTGKPRVTEKCLLKTIRSGSWYYFSPVSKAASRAKNDARMKSYNIGIRVAREMD
tara:strand:- start:83135 stop:83935 length:801 start_codon:yes stop_codon:yes gene_type:complete